MFNIIRNYVCENVSYIFSFVDVDLLINLAYMKAVLIVFFSIPPSVLSGVIQLDPINELYNSGIDADVYYDLMRERLNPVKFSEFCNKYGIPMNNVDIEALKEYNSKTKDIIEGILTDSNNLESIKRSNNIKKMYNSGIDADVYYDLMREKLNPVKFSKFCNKYGIPMDNVDIEALREYKLKKKEMSDLIKGLFTDPKNLEFVMNTPVEIKDSFLQETTSSTVVNNSSFFNNLDVNKLNKLKFDTDVLNPNVVQTVHEISSRLVKEALENTSIPTSTSTSTSVVQDISVPTTQEVFNLNTDSIRDISSSAVQQSAERNFFFIEPLEYFEPLDLGPKAFSQNENLEIFVNFHKFETDLTLLLVKKELGLQIAWPVLEPSFYYLNSLEGAIQANIETYNNNPITENLLRNSFLEILKNLPNIQLAQLMDIKNVYINLLEEIVNTRINFKETDSPQLIKDIAFEMVNKLTDLPYVSNTVSTANLDDSIQFVTEHETQHDFGSFGVWDVDVDGNIIENYHDSSSEEEERLLRESHIQEVMRSNINTNTNTNTNADPKLFLENKK